jgi:3-oxoacyl-[acyl-carrier protein] reductase
MDLKGKVALVTGGGTGLGRSICLKLAAEGASLAVNYSRSKLDAEKTAREAAALGVKAVSLQGNVGVQADLERMIERVAAEFGRLDVLVNNAGVTKVVAFSDLAGLDESDWDRMYSINAKSNFFLARLAAPLMRKHGGGSILNTVSTAGLKPSGSSIAYSVSKAAQLHLTKCLALALAPDIRVNGLAPGIMLTRWADGFTPEQIKAAVDKTLSKKSADVEECAAMAVRIIMSETMTGQIVTIDSGFTVQ